jgi:hypothetical protein
MRRLPAPVTPMGIRSQAGIHKRLIRWIRLKSVLEPWPKPWPTLPKILTPLIYWRTLSHRKRCT